MSEAHYGDQFGAEYLCLDKDPEYAIEGSKPNETLPRVGNLWFPPVSPLRHPVLFAQIDDTS